MHDYSYNAVHSRVIVGAGTIALLSNDQANSYNASCGAWRHAICLGASCIALDHNLCDVMGGTLDSRHVETCTIVLPQALADNAPNVPDAMKVSICR